jgi:hypothetical protein
MKQRKTFFNCCHAYDNFIWRIDVIIRYTLFIQHEMVINDSVMADKIFIEREKIDYCSYKRCQIQVPIVGAATQNKQLV